MPRWLRLQVLVSFCCFCMLPGADAQSTGQNPGAADPAQASSGAANPGPATSGAANSGAPNPGYTLQANSRVVLIDVTVTDNQGNPIHGLKATDFVIADNHKAQQLISFEEHRRDAAPALVPTSLAPGTYSNDYLQHPPATVNVLLLDLTNISLEDQAFLQFQLGKLFETLKPGEPVALYASTGHATILLQSFTADHGLLRTAVSRVIPRFPPADRQFLNDYATLHQISSYLADIPGRKNVLWFSGGSTLFLREDALQVDPRLIPLYDELEAQRIAIYPIDVRGLLVYDAALFQAQRSLMVQTAEATGGEAIINNNGIALAASRIVHADGDYYTLTYHPQPFVYNNKWHKVQVTIPGTYYTLHHRRGYFADANGVSDGHGSEARQHLLAGGRTLEEPDAARTPLIFQATVEEGRAAPATNGARESAKQHARATVPFTVHYSLPLEGFHMSSVNGRWRVECGAVVLAFDVNGNVVARHAEKTSFTLKDEAAQHPGGKKLPVDLTIDLKKGDAYLYVMAWDLQTHRSGWMEIPLRVDPWARAAVAPVAH